MIHQTWGCGKRESKDTQDLQACLLEPPGALILMFTLGKGRWVVFTLGKGRWVKGKGKPLDL